MCRWWWLGFPHCDPIRRRGAVFDANAPLLPSCPHLVRPLRSNQGPCHNLSTAAGPLQTGILRAREGWIAHDCGTMTGFNSFRPLSESDWGEGFDLLSAHPASEEKTGSEGPRSGTWSVANSAVHPLPHVEPARREPSSISSHRILSPGTSPYSRGTTHSMEEAPATWRFLDLQRGVHSCGAASGCPCPVQGHSL